MTIRTTIRGNPDARGRIRFDAKSLDVGFMADKTYDDGTPVASVAATHEFGSSDGRVPERAFFRGTLRESTNEVTDILARELRSRGRLSIHSANRAGQASVNEVRQAIQNADLIDTGTMLNSVDYEVD